MGACTSLTCAYPIWTAVAGGAEGAGLAEAAVLRLAAADTDGGGEAAAPPQPARSVARVSAGRSRGRREAPSPRLMRGLGRRAFAHLDVSGALPVVLYLG